MSEPKTYYNWLQYEQAIISAVAGRAMASYIIGESLNGLLPVEDDPARIVGLAFDMAEAFVLERRKRFLQPPPEQVPPPSD